jgi:hypothetical protein
MKVVMRERCVHTARTTSLQRIPEILPLAPGDAASQLIVQSESVAITLTDATPKCDYFRGRTRAVQPNFVNVDDEGMSEEKAVNKVNATRVIELQRWRISS